MAAAAPLGEGVSFTTGGRDGEAPAVTQPDGCAPTCSVCGVAFGRVYRPRLLTVTVDGLDLVHVTVCGRHQDAAVGAVLAALAPEGETLVARRADVF